MPDTNFLVFGSTGQVATELARLARVTTLSRAEADLSNPEACAAAIRARQPEAVINAAAWTAVDAAETDEETARVVNGVAPGAMAQACAELGIPFLHVSTDYVFDGSGIRPWCEDNATAPLGAYGRSKLAGEQAVAEAGGCHAILRTSWVFSAHGANFVKTMLRLAARRNAIDVVDDQVGGPTPAADIAAALLQMARQMTAGQGGTGLYHFSGVPWVSWAEFAREIFAQAGRDVVVTGISSTEYLTPAARPLNSRLDGTRLARDFGIRPPDWKTGLSQVLKELT